VTKTSLRKRLRYAFDNTMSRGTGALVAWLAIVTAVLIVVFSAIAAGASLSGHGFFSQLYHSLLHAMDPGTIGGDTGSWEFLLVMLLITIGGILVFSALIGVIATGLDNKLQDLRKGRSFVVERDHTLVLGWSDTIFTVISELAVANESEKKPRIVVLSDHDKVEMEDAIQARAGDTGKTRVVCRTGSPSDLDDLDIVNHQEARSIIVLSPDDDDNPDAQVIKTILALTRGPRRREGRYNIVAEIENPSNLEAAHLVGGDEAVLIDKQDLISRLVVQAARQSGASVVYTELLDFAGDEIYFRHDPSLAGKTFGDALFAYEECTVIGLQSNGTVALNPSPDTVIGPEDRVIAIAEDDSKLDVAGAAAAEPDESAIALGADVPDEPLHVLLLGWNSRVPSVIRELDNYVISGSSILAVADVAGIEEEVASRCGSLRNVEVTCRRGDTTDRATLESIELKRFEHAIVMCYSDTLDTARADARTLVTLLHLRDIAARQGSHITIVSEMLDDRNRELAQVTKVDDVIVSDKLISLLLAQISENAHLNAVFTELFRAEGSEVYLRPLEQYVRPNGPVSFATLVEAARRRREVAIGYRVAAESRDASKDYGVRVNPPKSAHFQPASGDRVIVLAED
jgi:voltage-gated potassium channel Kch